MQVLVHDDVRIDTRIDGSGDDAIVLIHGFPLAKEIWSEQMPALARSHRAIAIDLRGMGGSSVVDGPYLMETLAGDVAAVMDQLNVERATLVGHSLGGYVALAFARMYAERVARLALVCSRIAADSPERAAQRRAAADRFERDDSLGDIDATIIAMVSEKTRRGDRKTLENIEKIARRNTPRGLASMLRGMALRDGAEDIAPELEMPVLVVAGAADPVVPVAEADATAAAFARGRLEVLEGSGHIPMAETPASLTAVLVSFTSGPRGA